MYLTQENVARFWRRLGRIMGLVFFFPFYLLWRIIKELTIGGKLPKYNDGFFLGSMMLSGIPVFFLFTKRLLGLSSVPPDELWSDIISSLLQIIIAIEVISYIIRRVILFARFLFLAWFKSLPKDASEVKRKNEEREKAKRGSSLEKDQIQLSDGVTAIVIEEMPPGKRKR